MNVAVNESFLDDKTIKSEEIIVDIKHMRLSNISDGSTDNGEQYQTEFVSII
jgi:hypothetical protein